MPVRTNVLEEHWHSSALYINVLEEHWHSSALYIPNSGERWEFRYISKFYMLTHMPDRDSHESYFGYLAYIKLVRVKFQFQQ